jgi:hypothetical protein
MLLYDCKYWTEETEEIGIMGQKSFLPQRDPSVWKDGMYK